MTSFVKVFDTVLTIITVLASILLLLKIFVFQQVNVVGQSMQPNFFENQKLLLNKTETSLKRGEVVSVYETPEMAANANALTKTFPSLSGKPIKFLLKRVIAVPGDEIEMIGSKIIIYNNGQKEGKILEENYLPQSTKDQMESGCLAYNRYYKRTKITENKYFLMGDNRCNSFDSRDNRLGPFDQSMLLGGVVYKYWPLDQVGPVSLGAYDMVDIDLITQTKLANAQKSALPAL